MKGKSGITIVVVGLALGFGLVLLLRGFAEVDPDLARRPGAIDADADGRPSAPRRVAERPARALVQGDQATESPSTSFIPAIGTEAEAPGGGLLVRCLEAGSRAALADVTVWVEDEEGDPWRRALDHPDGDLPGPRARRYRSDRHGLLRIPEALPDRPRRLTAMTADRHACALDRNALGGGELVLELRPMKLVEVAVVDRAGRPLAGAPVEFRVASSAPLASAAALRTRVRTAGPGGRAWLPLLRRADDPEGSGVVMLGGLLGEAVGRPIDAAAPPTQPIRLVAPATGSVLVRRQGPRLPGPPRRRSLLIEEAGAAGTTTDHGGLLHRAGLLLDFAGESLRVDFVAIGLDLRLGLVPEALAPDATVTVRTRGPSRAGELVTIDLEAAPEDERLVFVGRLLDEDDRPLGEARVVPRITGRDGADDHRARSSPPQPTDIEGRFAFALPPVDESMRQGFEEPELVLVVTATDDSLREYRCPIGLGPGRQDLGDLRPRSQPLLVAGQVRDGLGRGVPGVRISARPYHRGDRSDRPRGRRFLTRSDAEGRYLIRGDGGPGEILVRPEAGARFGESRIVLTGSHDVDFVVTRLATLRATILAADPAILDRITLEVVERSHEELLFSIPRDGRLEVEIPPGRYYLNLRLGRERLSWEVNGQELVVAEGEVVDLGRIEVDRSTKLLRLRVEDAEGRLLGELATRWRHAPPGEEMGPYWTEAGIVRGELVMAVPALPVEVEIQAPGYRTLRQVIEGSPATLVLRPLIQISLRPGGGRELPPDVEILFSLREAEGPRFEELTSGRCSRARPECRLALPAAGRYLVDRFIVVAVGGRSESEIMSPGPGNLISVGEVAGDQEFSIAIDRDEFDAIVAELRRVLGEDGR
ncbi:MAG: hypothetical protein H6807_12505 [Planctomycetes bacterium]|nr:hypothetical protein [Planctomycetota bacterium]